MPTTKKGPPKSKYVDVGLSGFSTKRFCNGPQDTATDMTPSRINVREIGRIVREGTVGSGQTKTLQSPSRHR